MPLAALLLLTLAADPPPVGPTTLTLDFRRSPLPEVLEAISARSGIHVRLPDGDPPRDADPITLESDGPVPFWEAVDRLREAAGLDFDAVGGPPSPEPAALVFRPRPWPAAPGPAVYAGPFRLGHLRVAERHAAAFADGLHAGDPGPGFAGPDLPGFFAEFRAEVEPGVVAVRAGPTRALAAVDASGRSHLATQADREPWWSYSEFTGTGLTIRVALRRPAGPAADRLARFRGLLPVEVSRRAAEPAVSVPLAEAAGQTYRVGGVTLEVRSVEPQAGGGVRVRTRTRLEGPEHDPARVPWRLVAARLGSIHQHQFEVCDAEGRVVRSRSGGAGPYGNEWRARYHYEAWPGESGDPAELRFYPAERVAWDLPFEFLDVPLPRPIREPAP